MSEVRNKQISSLEVKPLFSVKDPISSLTHFIGFIGAIIATPILLVKAASNNMSIIDLVGLSVYLLSMILLYGASSAYHTFVLPYNQVQILKKIDHISVFMLIAGSYTPICLSVIRNSGGIAMLWAIWIAAICGLVMKLFWVNCPKYVSSIVYIAVGWIAIFSIKDIYLSLGFGGFFYLLLGGIFYTIGGVIYSLHLSFSKDWGDHEVFHLFVLAGSLCHYIMMLMYVA